MLKKLYFLYASDLDPATLVAPGGINNSILNSIPYFPIEIDLEVWGSSLERLEREMVERATGSRRFWFRAIHTADPLLNRKVPLNLRYMLALAFAQYRYKFERQSVIFAHRMEYVVSLAMTRPGSSRPHIVMFVHGSSRFSRIAMPAWKAWLYDRLERTAIKQADAVVFVSKDGLRYYQDRYPAHVNKFFHVPNPVDSDLFFPASRDACRNRLNLPAKDPIFCYHGRMENDKGVYLLLNTFSEIQNRLPSAHLILVGDGREFDGMKRHVTEKALVNVHFFGSVPREKVNTYINSADVSLLTSRFEGMSLGILESLACGVPVVATAVGDNAELILDGRSGAIVSEHKAPILADKALDILKNSKTLKDSCLEIARHYTPQNQTSALMDIARRISQRDKK